MAYLFPIETHVQAGTVEWKANANPSLRLNVDVDVKAYRLRMELTHTNGATPALTITDLFRILEKVEIVSGGRNGIKSVDGLKLYVNYMKNHGIVPKYSINTTASTADLTSYVIIEIPMCMFDMARPVDTILPAHQFQKLDLKLSFAGATDVGTDVTITSGLITVFEDGIENYNRKTAIAFNKEIMQTISIDSDNSKLVVQLPLEVLHKQLTLASIVDGVLVDTIIDSITLKGGQKVIKQMSALEIKEAMRKSSNVTDQSLFNGFLILDNAERGKNTSFINTRRSEGGFTNYTLEMSVKKVGTTNLVNLYTDYLEEVDPKAKA